MKNDINNIRFLRKFLSETQFKDFVELIKKDFEVKVICDGNIRIDYYYNGDLAYSYIVDNNIGVKREFEINLSKYYIKLLDKLLRDKTFIQLLRKHKGISLYKDYAYFYDRNLRYYYKKEIRLKVSRLIPKGTTESFKY